MIGHNCTNVRKHGWLHIGDPATFDSTLYYHWGEEGLPFQPGSAHGTISWLSSRIQGIGQGGYAMAFKSFYPTATFISEEH